MDHLDCGVFLQLDSKLHVLQLYLYPVSLLFITSSLSLLLHLQMSTDHALDNLPNYSSNLETVEQQQQEEEQEEEKV